MQLWISSVCMCFSVPDRHLSLHCGNRRKAFWEWPGGRRSERRLPRWPGEHPPSAAHCWKCLRRTEGRGGTISGQKMEKIHDCINLFALKVQYVMARIQKQLQKYPTWLRLHFLMFTPAVNKKWVVTLFMFTVKRNHFTGNEVSWPHFSKRTFSQAFLTVVAKARSILWLFLKLSAPEDGFQRYFLKQPWFVICNRSPHAPAHTSLSFCCLFDSNGVFYDDNFMCFCSIILITHILTSYLIFQRATEGLWGLFVKAAQVVKKSLCVKRLLCCMKHNPVEKVNC